MKKTFPLQVTGRDSARVLERVRSEVRKYVQREQKKTLPAGCSRWSFSCKVGADASTAVTKLLSEMIVSIDAVAKTGGAQVYVEIVASPVLRPTIDPEAPSSEYNASESRLPDRPD